jgi:hypothetical protein
VIAPHKHITWAHRALGWQVGARAALAAIGSSLVTNSLGSHTPMHEHKNQTKLGDADKTDVGKGQWACPGRTLAANICGNVRPAALRSIASTARLCLLLALRFAMLLGKLSARTCAQTGHV